MTALRFDGDVVVVTGAGNGVGRAHALELARRGARVVVNDLGVATDGSGGGEPVAEAVAREIHDLGGEAVASRASVATEAGGAAIVEAAVEAWGRLDMVVSNAGILRDRSFAKLSAAELDAVIDVHLRGSFFVCQPAFRWMKEHGGGRIVLTTSAAGLFGSFGQTNYSAAKLGVVGLAKSLAIEGRRSGITANCVAPMASTRLTAGIEEDMSSMAPEEVTPMVIALLHPSCTTTGETFLAGAGVYSRTWQALGPGWSLGRPGATAEDLVAHWDRIVDPTGATAPTDSMEIPTWLGAVLAVATGSDLA